MLNTLANRKEVVMYKIEVDQLKQFKDEIEADERRGKVGSSSDDIEFKRLDDAVYQDLVHKDEKDRQKSLKELVSRIKGYEKEHNLPHRHLLDNDLETIKHLAGL